MIDTLLIIGSADTAEDDIRRFDVYPIGYDRMMIGIDAYGLGRLPAKYFASYHPDDLVKLQVRPFIIISHRQFRGMVDIIRPIDLNNEPTGSSALLGVLAGIDEGYNKIILCGCPLIGRDKKNYEYSNFRKGWLFHYNHIKDKVRSMSGWTKELLQEPTKEWLDEK